MVDFKDVLAAHERIKATINRTPVMTSRTLNRLAGGEVFVKCENYQRMGAFKFRGAFNTLSQLTRERKEAGVITHSSGNHAQAVALSAKILGIRATIVMPKNSPVVKVNATRDTYGAEVVMCESTIEAREQTCQALMEKHGYTLVHPYDNDNVIAGAGTAALELLQAHGDLAVVVAPVGGGGLLSGTAIATKGFNDQVSVVGVEPEIADDAYRSFKAGKLLTNEKTPLTIADGLRTNLCERTFAIIQRHVDDVVLVSEKEILDATRFAWERMKMVVEPSGAVPLAALLAGKIDAKEKRVGVIISGGNIDLNVFFSLLGKNIHGGN